INCRAILEEAKEAQKFRDRPYGVSSAALATGKKLSKEQEVSNDDPFKLKTGGLVSYQEIKDRNRDRSDEDKGDRDVSNMSSTFAAETNKGDEHADMMKYIDEQMALKKGLGKDKQDDGVKYKSAEDKLYELPEHLQVAQKNRTEEMLSNQMLSGIPEVDLGVDAKIKNIELTEEAKQKHMKEQRSKKKNNTSFVPANMAVNYVQHARFLYDDSGGSRRQQQQQQQQQRKEEPAKPKPVVVGDANASKQSETETKPQKRSLSEKATDDYHFERFKKHLRRY
ncbi:telomere length and silencing protein 1 homolog, partial [Anneissia japonica]|uniref:telomere length and silencing protein 1 homolog n=1 Tax=Anneissia japonica TaxID=1529436 RepID=UPI0014257E7D